MTGGWGYFGSKWTITLRHTHTHLPETGAAVTHNEVCDCVCVCAVPLTQWEPKAD